MWETLMGLSAEKFLIGREVPFWASLRPFHAVTSCYNPPCRHAGGREGRGIKI